MKTNATSNDELKTAKSVTGRKNINSPAIPGQKIRGKKAAKVVKVEASTGKNIFCADNLNILSFVKPSFDLRLAYSTTIIAPSISIPTDNISENRTTTFIVTLKKESIIIEHKNDVGIEMLTNKPDFQPIKTTIIRSTINSSNIQITFNHSTYRNICI